MFGSVRTSRQAVSIFKAFISLSRVKTVYLTISFLCKILAHFTEIQAKQILMMLISKYCVVILRPGGNKDKPFANKNIKWDYFGIQMLRVKELGSPVIVCFSVGITLNKVKLRIVVPPENTTLARNYALNAMKCSYNTLPLKWRVPICKSGKLYHKVYFEKKEEHGKSKNEWKCNRTCFACIATLHYTSSTIWC